MNFRTKVLSGLLCILSLVPAASGRNVFVMSGGGANPAVNVYTGEPFVFAGSFLGSTAAFTTVSNPAGTKFYSVARSGSDTLVVTDQTFTNVVRRVNLADNGQAGVMTPDGRRMLVLAGTLHIFDTATDVEVAPPTALDVGVTPIDVAVSIDSRYAFVLSSTSQRLTRIDLTTNTISGNILTIPGQSTGVTAAPNGFLYVTATNQVIEIDGGTMTRRGEILLNGRPGKLAVTPDGRFGVAVNQTAVTGANAWMFNLTTRTLGGTISGLSSFGSPITFDSAIVVSNSRGFLFSKLTQSMVEVSVGATFNVFPVVVGGVGSPSGVVAMGASNEMPSARFLYYLAQGTLFRVDLGTNQLSGQITVPGTGAEISYTGAAGSGTPSSFISYNATQTIAAADTFRPLVVRALDSNGRPMFNVPVVFSTSVSGVTINGATSNTNADGLAMATVNHGSVTGSISVGVTIGGALSGTFSLTVGAGTPSGGQAGISIVSGNGQIIRENFLTQEPLTVVVRNDAGAPVAGATVTWTLTSGNGSLINATSVTDASGLATTSFVGTFVPPSQSYMQSTVSASAGSGSVNFIVTTVISQFAGNPAAAPLVELVKPGLEDRTVVGQAGQTQLAAIQVRVTVVSGPQSGQPIPNVGVTVTTGLDPAVAPSASCVGGTVLTDAVGIATCDLVLGGRIGTASLVTSVGGLVTTAPINLRVDPGPPGALTILQGNNQSGNPGQTLPLALVARVSDGFGNTLPGAAVQWEVVVSGTVTLSNVVSVADFSGRVGALATLGSTPGQVQVRVRTGTISAVFTLTVNVNVTQMVKVSGDNQNVVTGQPFPQPLVVQLNDAQNRAVPGVAVTFALSSGSAVLSATSATTDSQGRASVTVTAGTSAGGVVISASFTGLPSVTFNLTVRLPGPSLAVGSFTNLPGGQQGIVPGGIVRITAPGLAPGMQNCVMPASMVGGLPLQLASVTVQFGPDSAGLFAPIFYVCNIGGVESVAIQAPFELAAGITAVTIRVSGGASTINGVPVLPVQPGIFENITGTVRHGVVMRPDGSFVTPQNPARRGEIVCMLATGMGAVTPAPATNQAGIGGQNVLVPVVVGVNNAGVRVLRAEYAPNLIGVYLVYFEVPADTETGSARPLALAAVSTDGSLIFGNGSSIAIQ